MKRNLIFISFIFLLACFMPSTFQPIVKGQSVTSTTISDFEVRYVPFVERYGQQYIEFIELQLTYLVLYPDLINDMAGETVGRCIESWMLNHFETVRDIRDKYTGFLNSQKSEYKLDHERKYPGIKDSYRQDFDTNKYALARKINKDKVAPLDSLKIRDWLAWYINRYSDTVFLFLVHSYLVCRENKLADFSDLLLSIERIALPKIDSYVKDICNTGVRLSSFFHNPYESFTPITVDLSLTDNYFWALSPEKEIVIPLNEDFVSRDRLFEKERIIAHEIVHLIVDNSSQSNVFDDGRFDYYAFLQGRLMALNGSYTERLLASNESKLSDDLTAFAMFLKTGEYNGYSIYDYNTCELFAEMAADLYFESAGAKEEPKSLPYMLLEEYFFKYMKVQMISDSFLPEDFLINLRESNDYLRRWADRFLKDELPNVLNLYRLYWQWGEN